MSTTPTPTQTPAPGQATPKRKRHLARWVLLVLAALIGIMIVANAGGHPAPAPTTPVPTTAPTAALPAPAPSGPITLPPAPEPAPVPAQAPAQAGPLLVVLDGNGYDVGTGDGQLKPGKWHTEARTVEGLGYATVSAADGHAIQVINIDGPSTVTLKAGQSFETHGGAIWTWKSK